MVRPSYASACLKRLIGLLHGVDHALIGLLGRGPEGKDPMLQEDQALNFRVAVVDLCGCFGQGKAGHDVRDNAEAVAKKIR